MEAIRNREKASLRRDAARTCLAMGSYDLAKIIAMEAQTLDPEVEGLSEMIKVLDVCIPTENKAEKEVDRYEVLQVTPKDDTATIGRQFKSLAIAIHPDRNKCVGATWAFKVLTEAWGVLKDDLSRIAHDNRRSRRFARSFDPTRLTFWTACPNCKIHFEYFRSFVFKKILCSKCRVPFCAAELDLQFPGARASSSVASQF